MVYGRGATCDLNTDSYQSFFTKQDSLFSHCTFLNRPFPSSLVPLFQNNLSYFRMKMTSACSFMFMHIKVIFTRMISHLDSLWGPIHTNPFANKNGTVLLRFQKDLRLHLPFSYCFTCPHYNAVSVLKMLNMYPQCACSNELNACTFQYNYQLTKLVRNWSNMVASVCHFGYSQSSGLAPGVSIFDDITVFR